MKDIIGFYESNNSKNLFRITKNNDEQWLEEEPNAKFLLEELEHTNKKHIFETTGNLTPITQDEIKNFIKIPIRKTKIFGNLGEYLYVSK